MPPPRRFITAFGKTQSLTAWSMETGVHVGRLYERLKQGWSAEDAMSTDRFSQHVTRTYVQEKTKSEAYSGARNKPWQEDKVAQRLVREFGPLTLEDISRVMGCTREHIRQIEERALRKLRMRFGGRALHAQISEWLAALDEERGGRERTWPAPAGWGDEYGEEDAA